MSGISLSRIHRKWLGKYGDLEGLLASMLLAPLGDARGVVVRQHVCEQSRILFVGVQRSESGVVLASIERSPSQWLLWFPETEVWSAVCSRCASLRHTSARTERIFLRCDNATMRAHAAKTGLTTYLTQYKQGRSRRARL